MVLTIIMRSIGIKLLVKVSIYPFFISKFDHGTINASVIVLYIACNLLNYIAIVYEHTIRSVPMNKENHAKRLLVGVLTPSSNTALEPLTSALLSQVDNVSAHFSRFRVTKISLDTQDLNQFELSPILNAASLLTDAKVDIIGWSGTAAGWMGFDQDQTLCQAITDSTGIPATSSVLALNEILNKMAVKRIAIVSPYTADVQEKIVANYQSININTVAEKHLNISDNFAFSEVSTEQLKSCVMEVSKQAPDAILLYCTNLCSADQVSEWEAECNIPIIDTTSTVIWKMLREVGVDSTKVNNWGRFFQEAK